MATAGDAALSVRRPRNLPQVPTNLSHTSRAHQHLRRALGLTHERVIRDCIIPGIYATETKIIAHEGHATEFHEFADRQTQHKFATTYLTLRSHLDRGAQGVASVLLVGKLRQGRKSLAMKETFRCHLLLPFQLNVRSIHPDLVGAHPLRRRRVEHLASADSELGAVPGANDLVAVELSLRERAAAMRTGVVNGVNLPSTLNRAIFFLALRSACPG